MRRVFTLLFLLPLLWSTAALAQSYPEYESTTVNDFAGIIGADVEAQIAQQLETLHDETGVEMTVVTLSRQDMFAPGLTLEEFATGLFNAWGVGDKTTNDGVMILVLHGDRAMRIELGKAYGRDWDRAAAKVIDRSFLPAFKEDRYQDGIAAGVTDTIDTIVMPHRSGAEAPSDNSGDSWIRAIVVAVLAGLGLMFFKDKLVAFKKCPECGTRHLSRTRKVLHPATKTATGDGEMTTVCSNCSYRSVMPYTISRRSSSSRSSFGGGSSGGGGASGRW